MHIPFSRRHIGPSDSETAEMLRTLGCESLDQLIDQVVPSGIRLAKPLKLPRALSEEAAMLKLAETLGNNQVMRSFHRHGVPRHLHTAGDQRNILENPGWYTAYTPYQAEISQGRLEALINYQTMICDLTGLDVSNASLLDEGTAAAEAVALAVAQHGSAKRAFISDLCHPPTIEVVLTRTGAAWRRSHRGQRDGMRSPMTEKDLAAVVVQYPDTLGVVRNFTDLAPAVHGAGALLIACADLLALTLIKPPGEWGADICVGNSQRFGVPLGFGGPHAGFHGSEGCLEAPDAGPLDWCLERCAPAAWLPLVLADARAAHPSREGDEQHLHRAGAARRDGQYVCGVSWSRKG